MHSRKAALFGRGTRVPSKDKIREKQPDRIYPYRVKSRWLPLREIRVRMPLVPRPLDPPYTRRQTFWVWYKCCGPGRLYTATPSMGTKPVRYPPVQLSLTAVSSALAGRGPWLNCPQDHDDPWADYRPILKKGWAMFDPDLKAGYWYDKPNGIVHRTKVLSHHRTPKYDTYVVEETEVVRKTKRHYRKKSRGQNPRQVPPG